MAVCGVETGRGHEIGEELDVDAFATSAAELVVLDRDQGCLRLTGQSWDHPGLWVGFLELVHGTMSEELPHLRPIAFGGKEV